MRYLPTYFLIGVIAIAPCATAQTIAEGLVGRATPPRTSLDFLRYMQELELAVLGACPLTRTTTYYVDQDGGSDAGAGTIGDPWQTISKVNTFLSTGTPSDVAILFQRGDIWAVDVGLTVPATADGITLGSYGAGRNPKIHAFTTNFTGGTDWADSGDGLRYTTTLATAPGWVRIAEDPDRILRKVANTTECSDTPNSWFHTGSTLSVHITSTSFGATAIDPDTVTIEATLTTMTDDAGVEVAAGSTDIRIDSLDFDGWGCDGTATNQEYGIRASSTGSDIVCVTNCAAHYNSRHSMGHNGGGGAGAGGLVLWLNNTCGGCIEATAAPWVAYCGSGAQEDWNIGMTVDVGSLPLTATRDYAEGVACYAHSDGVVSPGMLVIAGLRVPKHPQGFGCHTGASLNNVTLAADVDDCQGIKLLNYVEEANGTGCNGVSGHVTQGPQSGVVDLGSTYYWQPITNSVAAICSQGSAEWDGWWINVAAHVNLAHSGMTSSDFGIFNVTDSPNSMQAHFWHDDVNVVGNGTTNFTLTFDGNFDVDAGVNRSDGTEFVNSVFAAIRPNGATLSSPVFRVGLRDSAVNLRNNAYYGLSADGTYVGSASTANPIYLSRAPEFEIQPQLGSALVGAGEVGLTPLDYALRPRSITGPTVGPFEYLPASQYATTTAELAEQLWAATSRTLTADQSAISQLGGIDVSGAYAPANVLQANSVDLPDTTIRTELYVDDDSGGGDGRDPTHAFVTITAAKAALPTAAGRLIVLPGSYIENVTLDAPGITLELMSGATIVPATGKGISVTANDCQVINGSVNSPDDDDLELGAVTGFVCRGTTFANQIDVNSATDYDFEHVVIGGTYYRDIGFAPFLAGIAQGGTATTIQLAAVTSYPDDALNDYLVKTLGGTGAGQSQVITDWDAATDTATVAAFSPAPDATTTYQVIANSAIDEAGVQSALTAQGYTSARAPNLDYLDSAISDIVAGTTQPRVNYRAGRAYRLKISDTNDDTYKAVTPVRLRPGVIAGDGIAVSVDMSPLYGEFFVSNVGAPSVSGGSLTASALGPRDTEAMILIDGTATASEQETITFDVTMDTGGGGETVPVTIDIVTFAE